MLQICDATGHWTAVCDYSWGCNEAMVACKQLGYNTPCELCKVLWIHTQAYGKGKRSSFPSPNICV